MGCITQFFLVFDSLVPFKFEQGWGLMGIGWGVVQKLCALFDKHFCFLRTYPDIMYNTCLVITKSNFTC